LSIKIIKRTLFALTIVLFFFSGCQQPENNLDFSKPFTEEQAFNVLQDHFRGIISYAKEDNLENDNLYKISNGAVPTIYLLNGGAQKLYLYTFNSLPERKKHSEEVHEKFLGHYPTFSDIAKHTFMPANNLLFVHERPELNEMGDETRNFLRRTIFRSLNPCQEILLVGSGDYWDIELTTGYYEYFYEENNQMTYDAAHVNEGKIYYKNKDWEKEDWIYADLILPMSAFSGPLYVNEEGEGKLGPFFGTGSVQKKRFALDLTLSWNDKKDHILLDIDN
jgi:hypothetical protein